MTGSAAEAQDILQETYLRAHLALRDGQFEARAAFETWLYRVAVNASLDVLRRRKRRRAFLALFRPVVSTPAEHTEAHVALAQTQALLATLPPDQAGALVLTQVEGLSNADAAAALGCSEGAIEQRLIRARAALRRLGEP
jgi:RNA polymerase sigma-70 factor (ECF subfamily)